MSDSDKVSLLDDDFRRERTMLSPSVFFWENGEPNDWPQHADLIDPKSWEHVMGLATHVALESSGHMGTVVARLNQLNIDWTFSWPEPNVAPFMDYPALIAGEEFDAFVFNALHGYYRQAIGCLRVSLETLAMAAGFVVTNDTVSFNAWQEGNLEDKFGRARILLRDSPDGRQIDAATYPGSVFGDSNDSWINKRYKRSCSVHVTS
jgi:hypothetical protein